MDAIGMFCKLVGIKPKYYCKISQDCTYNDCKNCEHSGLFYARLNESTIWNIFNFILQKYEKELQVIFPEFKVCTKFNYNNGWYTVYNLIKSAKNKLSEKDIKSIRKMILNPGIFYNRYLEE